MIIGNTSNTFECRTDILTQLFKSPFKVKKKQPTILQYKCCETMQMIILKHL